MPDRVDAIMLYARTLATLRPSQTLGRLAYRLRKPRLTPAPTPAQRDRSAAWTAGCLTPASMLGPDRFVFLNQVRDLGDQGGWNARGVEKLWLYNLHYFDDLNAVDADQRQDWHVRLIERWVRENPVGAGNGWEPYTLSLRIVNWIKFALRQGTLSATATESLANQVRYLTQRLEHHILGNHLLANAKALIFAGCYFAGEEADHWLGVGLRILAQQVDEQILDDGAHFELSPMYHAIVLTDFLDIINMAGCYQVERRIPDLRVADMLSWLRAMSHPDGDVSFFNDSAFGIAAPYDALRDYAVRLGVAPAHNPALTSTHLAASGYLRLANQTAVLLIDAAAIGPRYLPAHAHADTLSFELSLRDRRVLVNGGTSRYGTGPERHLERSTAAHNTLVIDGENSSEVWAGFRAGRRAKARIDRVDIGDTRSQTVAAQHDGYRRLPGRNLHHRVCTLQEDALLVDDKITGPFQSAELFFHCHPDAQVTLADNEATITVGDDLEVKLIVDGGVLRCEQDNWHPGFGIALPSTTLVAKAHGNTLKSRFTWTSRP